MSAAATSTAGNPEAVALTPAKHVVLLATPVVLPVTTYLVFQWAVGLLGFKLGYFTGFLFYWLGWCLLLPLWILGAGGLRAAFQDRKPRFGKPAWLGLGLLIFWPLACWGSLLPTTWLHPDPLVVLLSIPITLVNASAEEVLWRAVYTAAYPRSLWLGYLYPTVGFAVWHYAPQSLISNRMPGGAHSFVIAALLFGLSWGWVAWQSRSVRWTTVSHFFLDYAGLGARIYLG